MPRYVLTGTPGSGKTTILHLLHSRGAPVVGEAATDVIAAQQALGVAQPWTDPGFVDQIVALQRQREASSPAVANVAVFFDRSPVCTLALSRYSGYQPSAQLMAEIERVLAERIYEPSVFFVRHLGFLQRTSARQINLADALEFERLHERTYRELGFRLVDVPAGPLAGRATTIQRFLDGLPASPGRQA